jgi:signal peptidase I
MSRIRLDLLLGGLSLGGLALWWARRRYLVATVDGRSMEPTLHAGDRLLVRRTRRVRAGQIVVVEIPVPVLPDGPPPGVGQDDLDRAEETTPVNPPDHPDRQLLVKRAVAVAGDPVPRQSVPALRDVPETVVPRGSLVVLGDNPAVSWDSRDYGFVRPDQFVGVMVRRLPPR